MFTWLLYLFPSLNFSTFILINTIVILINATTILAIKYKHGNISKEKEKSATKRRAKGKSRKSSPRIKKRSPQKTNTVDQLQRTVDQRVRSKNIKTEGDESINTTLDEITWVSSVGDEADSAYRESKFYAGGQRQHRSPQQKSRRNHPDSQSGGSNRVAHRLLHSIGGEDDCVGRKRAISVTDGHSIDVADRIHNTPVQTNERQTSPLRNNKYRHTDKCSAAMDAPSQNTKRTRQQIDSCERSNQSPKEKPPTPKSAQSSGWSSNLSNKSSILSNTKCDICAAEYQSLSSEHQIGSNKSEVSTNLNRDSWIWFSSQCPTNAGNFAARQDTFRSADPRVPELLAEINRQDQMNEDIQREANSLIISDPSKRVPRYEIKEPCDAHSCEKRLPGCPIMRRNGIVYNDKSLQGLEAIERAKYDNGDMSNTSQGSPPPSNTERGSGEKADGNYPENSRNMIPTYRPRVQFVSPKMHNPSSQGKKKIAREISPQNFSSIVYNHHKQEHPRRPSSKSKRSNKSSPGSDVCSQEDGFVNIGGPVNSRKSGSNHFIKPSASCVFQPISKHKSPKRSHTFSPERQETCGHGNRRNSPDTSHTSSLRCYKFYDEKGELYKKKNEASPGPKCVQEKHCPPEYYHSTVQSREESESDSLFVMSTSLETYGDKTNQIGQEVSRTIKSIIFNNDSHSSTSNSKLGSSLQSKAPQKSAEVQVTPVSPSNRKRKGATTNASSPRSRPCKVDQKGVTTKNLSPPSKPRKYDCQETSADTCHKRYSPPVKDKQRKYVFGSSYYLSTRSQSQLKLCSSRSCTSDESFSRPSRYESRAQGSKSANFVLPTPRAKITPSRICN